VAPALLGLAVAIGDYANLLTRGASMPAVERDRILGRLADLIGLPIASTWCGSDLRLA
jgi:hypothetical protein